MSNKIVLVEVGFDELAVGIAEYWDYHEIINLILDVDGYIADSVFTEMLKTAVNRLDEGGETEAPVH